MRRRRQQHGLSMSKRRRRRVRRHRRFSVPGEVREVGFLVDGDWPVWERFPRPGPPASARSPRRLGEHCWPWAGAPSRPTCSWLRDLPALRGQPSVPGLRLRGGPGAGKACPGAGNGGGRPRRAQQGLCPEAPRCFKGERVAIFSDYFGVLIREGTLRTAELLGNPASMPRVNGLVVTTSVEYRLSRLKMTAKERCRFAKEKEVGRVFQVYLTRAC